MHVSITHIKSNHRLMFLKGRAMTAWNTEVDPQRRKTQQNKTGEHSNLSIYSTKKRLQEKHEREKIEEKIKNKPVQIIAKERYRHSAIHRGYQKDPNISEIDIPIFFERKKKSNRRVKLTAKWRG